MSDGYHEILNAVERQHAEEPAATRRRFVQGAAATIGAVGLLGLPAVAGAAKKSAAAAKKNDPQTILNVAVTAEILATIVNTVGSEKASAATPSPSATSARRRARSWSTTTSCASWAPCRWPSRIWVPDAVFASLRGCSARWRWATRSSSTPTSSPPRLRQRRRGRAGDYAAEFMGVEAVHRALARQSLGKLGNDRVFMKYDEKERLAGCPGPGQPGVQQHPDGGHQPGGRGLRLRSRGQRARRLLRLPRREGPHAERPGHQRPGAVAGSRLTGRPARRVRSPSRPL